MSRTSEQLAPVLADVPPWSIRHHPEWRILRTYLRLESYARDKNWAGDIRNRIEVLEPDHESIRAWLLNLTWYCARCGELIHRVRARSTRGTLYFASAHLLAEKIACSRSPEAAEEYRLVVEDLTLDPPLPPPQMALPFRQGRR